MGKVKTISAFGEDFEAAALELSRAVGDCALTVADDVWDDLHHWAELKTGERMEGGKYLIFQGINARITIAKKEKGKWA